MEHYRHWLPLVLEDVMGPCDYTVAPIRISAMVGEVVTSGGKRIN